MLQSTTTTYRHIECQKKYKSLSLFHVHLTRLTCTHTHPPHHCGLSKKHRHLVRVFRLCKKLRLPPTMSYIVHVCVTYKMLSHHLEPKTINSSRLGNVQWKSCRCIKHLVWFIMPGKIDQNVWFDSVFQSKSIAASQHFHLHLERESGPGRITVTHSNIVFFEVSIYISFTYMQSEEPLRAMRRPLVCNGTSSGWLCPH